MCEIWFTVNCAAYHLAYTRVYLQTRSMQTHVDKLRLDEQTIKDQGQADVIIRWSILASFFRNKVFGSLSNRSVHIAVEILLSLLRRTFLFLEQSAHAE